jgi:hypothetical protein
LEEVFLTIAESAELRSLEAKMKKKGKDIKKEHKDDETKGNKNEVEMETISEVDDTGAGATIIDHILRMISFLCRR